MPQGFPQGLSCYRTSMMSLSKRTWLSGAMTLLFLSSSCSRKEAGTGEAGPAKSQQKVTTGQPCDNWISGKEARELVREGGVLLDVRTPEEFARGHLDGARNIEVDALGHRLSELSPESPVVVYCQSGKRAHRAALLLKEKGYLVSEIGTQAKYAPEAPAGCRD